MYFFSILLVSGKNQVYREARTAQYRIELINSERDKGNGITVAQMDGIRGYRSNGYCCWRLPYHF